MPSVNSDRPGSREDCSTSRAASSPGPRTSTRTFQDIDRSRPRHFPPLPRLSSICARCGVGTCANTVPACVGGQPNTCTPLNGTACNDGNPCTAGDVCTAGVCNGTPVPPPAVINNSVRADKTPTDTTIAWNDPPGSYSVYRGSMFGGSAWSYTQTCLSGRVSGNSAPDTGVPAPGQLFYYVVSRVDACGESSLGTNSAGVPRPNGAPCP